MLVRCIRNTGRELGDPSRGSFYSSGTTYHLKAGATYVILGMGMFETVLLALVRDDTDLPTWVPVGLFEIEQQAAPAHWQLSVLDGVAASGGDAMNRWVMKWGYPELVQNDRHSDDLLEREVPALVLFEAEYQARIAQLEDDDLSS